jgi:hypothetical protein
MLPAQTPASRQLEGDSPPVRRAVSNPYDTRLKEPSEEPGLTVGHERNSANVGAATESLRAAGENGKGLMSASELSATSPDAGGAGAGLLHWEGRMSRVGHAFFAIFGLLIGVLVTSGITYIGDRNHRIADERTAKRLVANEIRVDTQSLAQVEIYGKVIGAAPQSVQWETSEFTLARYAADSQWGPVAVFYDGVLRIQPSLSRTKVTRHTRALAFTLASMGNCALEALGQPPLPSAPVCR